MAENNNPWYRKKAHCAKLARHWMEQLQRHPQISLVYEESGVRVLEKLSTSAEAETNTKAVAQIGRPDPDQGASSDNENLSRATNRPNARPTR